MSNNKPFENSYRNEGNILKQLEEQHRETIDFVSETKISAQAIKALREASERFIEELEQYDKAKDHLAEIEPFDIETKWNNLLFKGKLSLHKNLKLTKHELKLLWLISAVDHDYPDDVPFVYFLNQIQSYINTSKMPQDIFDQKKLHSCFASLAYKLVVHCKSLTSKAKK